MMLVVLALARFLTVTSFKMSLVYAGLPIHLLREAWEGRGGRYL